MAAAAWWLWAPCSAGLLLGGEGSGTAAAEGRRTAAAWQLWAAGGAGLLLGG